MGCLAASTAAIHSSESNSSLKFSSGMENSTERKSPLRTVIAADSDFKKGLTNDIRFDFSGDEDDASRADNGHKA